MFLAHQIMSARYTIGRVVQRRNTLGMDSDEQKFGHITGFGRNASGELLVCVKWETHIDRGFADDTVYMHTANVILI